MEEKVVDIQKFADKLLEACRARDASANVSVIKTPFQGEYVAVVQTQTSIEHYAFNLFTGAWIICYTM